VQKYKTSTKIPRTFSWLLVCLHKFQVVLN